METATFDSKQMNYAILAEFVLAVFVTQIDGFRRLLDTTQLNLQQFASALVSPVAMLVLSGRPESTWPDGSPAAEPALPDHRSRRVNGMQLSRWAPGVRMLSTYRTSWLTKDLVAGLVLTTLLVPQGMAYAELAGLPAITGLYTSILCLVGYALFGPSRILVLGPDSSLGPMIAATILPLIAAKGDPERAVALASMLALMVGAIMVLASVAKLGFIADLISKPTMIGYMNGLALTILIGQLPKLFGFKVEAEGLLGELTGFVKGLA